MSGLTVIPQSDMRAITLYAEYAHAVVTGDKTIETRPRPCSHRGWVGIHAAASVTHLRAGERRQLGRFDVERDQAGLLLRGMAWPYRLPLGAIVAVARVVDCVPMVWDDTWPPRPDGAGAALEIHASGLALWRGGQVDTPEDVTEDLPYGVFAPGRFALLLEDVTRLPRPVPAKGNQAVPWRVPEDVAAKVREQLEVAS